MQIVEGSLSVQIVGGIGASAKRSLLFNQLQVRHLQLPWLLLAGSTFLIYRQRSEKSKIAPIVKESLSGASPPSGMSQ